MNSVAGNVIIDACTLQNFVIVDQLDLLKTRYGERICWTETTQFEINRGVRAEPLLQQVLSASWLGVPLQIAGDAQTLQRIDRIRRGLGATRTYPATLHLGEAEIIDFLQTRQPSWIFVSDDQPAVDLAKRRGLNAIDSPQVLADCYAFGEIGCPAAYELLVRMRAAGRGVRVPPDHRHVCP